MSPMNFAPIRAQDHAHQIPSSRPPPDHGCSAPDAQDINRVSPHSSATPPRSRPPPPEPSTCPFSPAEVSRLSRPLLSSSPDKKTIFELCPEGGPLVSHQNPRDMGIPPQRSNHIARSDQAALAAPVPSRTLLLRLSPYGSVWMFGVYGQ